MVLNSKWYGKNFWSMVLNSKSMAGILKD